MVFANQFGLPSLVNVYSLLLKMDIEIVDLPMNSMGRFSIIFLLTFTRGYIFYHEGFDLGPRKFPTFLNMTF